MDTKISTITKEQLLANGWKETGDPVYVMEKKLAHNEDGDEESNHLDLVLHRLNNDLTFGLVITDGYRIDINPSSIEELNLFESLIMNVDAPY